MTDLPELDMTGSVVIASVIIPPADMFCATGLCGQKACVTLVLPDRSVVNSGEPTQAYVLSLCEPHAMFMLATPVERAAKAFPPDLVGDDYPDWLDDAA